MDVSITSEDISQQEEQGVAVVTSRQLMTGVVGQNAIARGFRKVSPGVWQIPIL